LRGCSIGTTCWRPFATRAKGPRPPMFVGTLECGPPASAKEELAECGAFR